MKLNSVIPFVIWSPFCRGELHWIATGKMGTWKLRYCNRHAHTKIHGQLNLYNREFIFSISHFVSGFSLAHFTSSNSAKNSGVAFVISPMVTIIEPNCLTFRYYLRSDLKLLITNSTLTILMAAFHVDSGFDFHQAFIDLTEGRYQFVWEAELNQPEPLEIIRNYRAAIDDVEVVGRSCAQLRKFRKAVSSSTDNTAMHWWIRLSLDKWGLVAYHLQKYSVKFQLLIPLN